MEGQRGGASWRLRTPFLHALPPRFSSTLLLHALLVPSLPAQSALASLPGSTRAAALGGAEVALVGTAGAVFANPAGIATIRHLSVEGAYQLDPGGGVVGAGALALRAGRLSWGFGGAALDTAGTLYRARDVLGVSSVVYRLSFIALGTSVKYVRQSGLGGGGGATADAWAGDAGIAIALFDIMALGVSVQNIGGDLGRGSRLPRRTRAGFTMNYVDPQGTWRLLTTLEGQWPTGGRGGPSLLLTGVETGIVTHGLGLFGRAGYAPHAVPGAASPFTFGAGVALGRLQVDYAYQAFDPPRDPLHRFGLRWTP